jgi:hypothetical protein
VLFDSVKKYTPATRVRAATARARSFLTVMTGECRARRIEAMARVRCDGENLWRRGRVDTRYLPAISTR